MTTYKAKGTLLLVGETREFSSGFTSRKFVVDTTEKPDYKSPVEFTLKKNRVGDIDGYKPGEAVEVEFSIDGRQWDGPNGTKYYIDLSVWHISRLGVVQAAGGTTTAAATTTTTATTFVSSIQTAIDTWKKYHGEDLAGMSEFCAKVRPDIAKAAQLSGMKFSQYAEKRTDVWGEIVAKLEEEAKAASDGDDFDDMPF